jgi:AbrB family looped-hinge helix DNA binding protein
MTITAKITSKNQTTIPQEIREALQVGPGDSIAWNITGDGTVCVRRIEPLDASYLKALEGTLGEWSGVADEKAYHDL